MPIITPHAQVFCAIDIPALAESTETSEHVFLPNNTELAEIKPRLNGLKLIVIDFPSVTDGRGLSLGKTLRDAGYRGVLRAKGEITPDQYPMALLCGFDEVEISEERLARQPRAQWQAVDQVHLWRERLNAKVTPSHQGAQV